MDRSSNLDPAGFHDHVVGAGEVISEMPSRLGDRCLDNLSIPYDEGVLVRPTTTTP
ncbi:MAG: hypothetical protein U9R47_06805 [Actinomycetota bacterium]|nr:hypothetical protein [Actinomycetota bacterium]